MAYNYSSPESFVSSFNAAPTTKPWMVSDPNNPGGQMRDPGATGTPQATSHTDPTTGMTTTGIMNPFGLVWNGSQNAGFIPGANAANNASAPSWLGGGQQQTQTPTTQTPPATTPPPSGNDPNTVAGGQGGYTGTIGGQTFVNGVVTGNAPPPADPNFRTGPPGTSFTDTPTAGFNAQGEWTGDSPGFGSPELSRSPAANPGTAVTDGGGRRLSAFQSFPQQPPQDFGNQQNQQQANQPGSMDLSGMGQNFPPAFMNMLQQLLGSMGGQQQQPGMGMGSSGGPNSPGNYYGEAPTGASGYGYGAGGPEGQNAGMANNTNSPEGYNQQSQSIPNSPLNGGGNSSFFGMLPQIQQLLQGLMGNSGGAYQGQRQEQYGRNFA